MAPILSRRHFLGLSLLGSAGYLAGCRTAPYGSATDPNRVALLADSHIASSRDKIHSGVNLYNNMKQVVAEVLSMSPRPANVIIAGDCAFSNGRPEEYKLFAELIAPLTQAGVAVHLAAGNHDNFENLRTAFGPVSAESYPVQNRRTRILPTPHMNWFLLDSRPGDLGTEQLKWLAKALDNAGNKSAALVFHHNIITTDKDGADKPSDPTRNMLHDAPALWDVLLQRKQVRAIIFGHTHFWETATWHDRHLVNLPAVSYVFEKTTPNGWVDCQLTENTMSLRLHCLDAAHPKNNEHTCLSRLLS